jgi:hypothetical protein
MSKKNRSHTIERLLKLAGEEKVIETPLLFIDFTGDRAAADMLAQLLRWSARPVEQDGWMAVPDYVWMRDLRLTRYAVRQGRARLEQMGLVTTVVRMRGSVPTLHYRLDLPALMTCWSDWCTTSQPQAQSTPDGKRARS